MAPRVVSVEADGGSRGNPGPAGYGAVVRDPATGEVLAERSESLGTATNNVAEYQGLIAGLTAAAELGAAEVDVRMDSKLVVEQMCGRWQIKHPGLRPARRPGRRAGGPVRPRSGSAGSRASRTGTPTPSPTPRWTPPRAVRRRRPGPSAAARHRPSCGG